VALRIISNVPKEKLTTILTDLEYEVGKANIKKTESQPDGTFRIEYDPDQATSPSRQASRSSLAQ
jgi:hypothetical protein